MQLRERHDKASRQPKISYRSAFRQAVRIIPVWIDSMYLEGSLHSASPYLVCSTCLLGLSLRAENVQSLFSLRSPPVNA